MYCAESKSFFEISIGPQLDNTLRDRLLCVKDFLKKAVLFPFALIGKAFCTFFKVFALCFGASLILITIGSSGSAREFFLERISALAKDLADWLFLPFAILSCFLRLILAILIHPNLYFNAID